MIHHIDKKDLAFLQQLITDDKIAPKLIELSCNLERFKTPLDFPCKEHYDCFNELYINLISIRNRRRLVLYLNGIQLDLRIRDFRKYRFDDQMIQCRYVNHTKNKLRMLACRTAYRVEYAILKGWLFELRSDQDTIWEASAREFNITLFNILFPNLRFVTLSGNRANIRYEPFVGFLMQCRALNYLKLHNSAFNSGFYRMLGKLRSVNTLTEFIMEDETDWLGKVQFEFLANMPFLLRLKTNLANRQSMVLAIEKMRVGAEFVFVFTETKFDPYPNRCEVQRINQEEWNLSLIPGPGSRHKAEETILNLNDILEHLEENAAELTSHWRDLQL